MKTGFRTMLLILLLFSVVPIVWAADDGGETAKTSDKETTTKLEPYECGNVARLHVFGQIFLASQPDQEDFKIAKEAGIKTIVDLREKDELDWNEQAHVERLGMQYVRVPFQSPDSLTGEVFDEVRKLLKNEEMQPLILHCSSANRVGAVWLAHRVLDGGLTVEQAEEEAETVGLRLSAYAEQAKDYIEREQK